MPNGMLGPPKWLEQGRLWRSTVEVALQAGWFALHSAALGGDRAAIQRGSSHGAARIVVRWANYQHRTAQIARRAGIVVPENSTAVSVTAFSEDVARVLVDGVPHVPRRQRVSIAAFPDLWRDEEGLKRKPLNLDFTSPYSLLRSGYKACQQEQASSRVEHSDRVGLLAVAIGVRGIALMARCELCFRWAVPGYRFCHQHSQSNAAPGSPRERSARYRRGRRIGGEFKFLEREPPVCATRPALRLPRFIARVLWATPLPDEERTADAVRRALRRNDAVLEIVGTDALKKRTAQLFKRLETRLDPYEVNPSAWVWIIGRAAKWARIEAAIESRPRRMQFETRMRIYDATRLAECGLTKTKIADRLGIRASTISNWLKRGIAPKLVTALKEQEARRVQQRYIETEVVPGNRTGG